MERAGKGARERGGEGARGGSDRGQRSCVSSLEAAAEAVDSHPHFTRQSCVINTTATIARGLEHAPKSVATGSRLQ